MYCKHCGKLISDDSKFCQHCGGNLELKISDAVDNPEHSETKKMPPQIEGSSIIPLIGKYKIWIAIYSVWVILNFFLLLQGIDKIYEKSTLNSGLYGNTFRSNEVFFPFTSTGYQTSFWFNTKYYDWTELLVYCLLLPLIIYIVITAWKNYGSGSVIAKLDSLFDDKIKDNIMKTSSKIEYGDVLKDIEDKDKHIDSLLSKPEESPKIRLGNGGNEESYNNETNKYIVDFIKSAFKIVGVIVIALPIFVLSLMYLHNFILGCILSLVGGLLSYYLIRRK